MGRSYFSVSNINRMVSAYSAYRKQQELNRLISVQSNLTKNFAPTYELLSVNFDKETRITRIVIEQTQRYRTIERYVTRNYEKFPIYSDIKQRTKKINKTIKLTNLTLESLNYNDDELISKFAIEIINALNDENLYPSWFIIWSLRNNCKEKIELIQSENAAYRQSHLNEITKIQTYISKTSESIANQKKILAKLEKQCNKLQNKIASINAHDKPLLWILLSFGIYAYFNSKRRKYHIESKLLEQKEKFNNENAKKEKSEMILQQHVALVKHKQCEINQKAKDTAQKIKNITTECEENVKKVQPLPSIVSAEDESFIPLKTLIGYDYSKIVGCYVIHNKENDKYYVGQSKDVMKRIKQHFKGTVPANMIFAEDYYMSTFYDKDDLFEVKIIQCATKNELDDTERALIEKYDSFHSGYNGTGGNK